MPAIPAPQMTMSADFVMAGFRLPQGRRRCSICRVTSGRGVNVARGRSRSAMAPSAFAGDRVAVIRIQLSHREGDVRANEKVRIRDGHPGPLHRHRAVQHDVDVDRARRVLVRGAAPSKPLLEPAQFSPQCPGRQFSLQEDGCVQEVGLRCGTNCRILIDGGTARMCPSDCSSRTAQGRLCSGFDVGAQGEKRSLGHTGDDTRDERQRRSRCLSWQPCLTETYPPPAPWPLPCGPGVDQRYRFGSHVLGQISMPSACGVHSQFAVPIP